MISQPSTRLGRHALASTSHSRLSSSFLPSLFLFLFLFPFYFPFYFPFSSTSSPSPLPNSSNTTDPTIEYKPIQSSPTAKTTHPTPQAPANPTHPPSPKPYDTQPLHQPPTTAPQQEPQEQCRGGDSSPDPALPPRSRPRGLRTATTTTPLQPCYCRKIQGLGNDSGSGALGRHIPASRKLSIFDATDEHDSSDSVELIVGGCKSQQFSKSPCGIPLPLGAWECVLGTRAWNYMEHNEVR
ncbi:hypothetical protein BP00DRAFT_23311 [Aspergillus indologenus CBS 114.80]|uniref:Uncharacterized protein n=1 Tax=Aspergillus indologenus CBS 114.80 TaxID=1450541 RepID=A0A2V5HSK9_9EURO|nr:hypothetical protein BP00DRAFT_23311 [Aspergillus indologenus CBS 114.80]